MILIPLTAFLLIGYMFGRWKSRWDILQQSENYLNSQADPNAFAKYMACLQLLKKVTYL